jgi:hypothetical protein
MNTFSILYADSLDVPFGTTVIGDTVTMGLQKSSCLTLYTIVSTDGSSMTITLEVNDPNNITEWFQVSGVSVLTLAGGQLAVPLTLPPGAPGFRLKFHSNSAAGSDTVNMTIAGLPQGTVVS